MILAPGEDYVFVGFPAVDVIYTASNKDKAGLGASGQVQELQERSRTIRSITRMIRTSSWTTFTLVLRGLKRVQEGLRRLIRTCFL